MAKILLGDRIYELRKQKGITQEELAYMVGVSNKAVSKWETSEANPDIGLIPRLAEIFGVTCDYMFGKVSDSNSDSYQVNSGKKPTDFVTEHNCKDKLFGLNGTATKEQWHYEFKSDRMNRKGQPYLHVNIGLGFYKAKGTIAIGTIANGIVSIGLVSVGIISIGLLALGLIALGSTALGLFVAVGAVAAGIGVSAGAVAIGTIAVGAVSIGIISVGALAIGLYAYTGGTGVAIGLYTAIFRPL